MRRMFRDSVAVIVSAAALTGPVWAQTAAPLVVPAPATDAAPAPAAPAAPATPPASSSAPAAPTAGAVPQPLAELGITDATVSDGKRGGKRVEGALPGGTTYQAMLDAEGQLRMIRVKDDAAALTPEVVDGLVPQAVRANAIYGEFARLHGVATGDRGVMLFGVDAKDEAVRAGFSPDGMLQQFGRGDREKEGRMGPGKGDKHGKRDHHKGKRGDRGEGDRTGMDARPQLDDAAVQRVLTEGGYTDVTGITRDGPRVEAQATNPEGEAVMVTVNPRGVVVKELAR